MRDENAQVSLMLHNRNWWEIGKNRIGKRKKNLHWLKRAGTTWETCSKSYSFTEFPQAMRCVFYAPRSQLKQWKWALKIVTHDILQIAAIQRTNKAIFFLSKSRESYRANEGTERLTCCSYGTLNMGNGEDGRKTNFQSQTNRLWNDVY